MSTKEYPNRKVGFLLTEVAMGLLDYMYFDLDGKPVKDLECLTKFQKEEEDYSKNDKDLVNLLKISTNSLNVSDNCYNIADTIDLDDAEDTDESNEINHIVECAAKYFGDDINSIKENNTENSTKFNEKSDLEDIDSTNISQSDIEQVETETEADELSNIEQDIPNSLLIKSTIRPERVKYLTYLTKKEFLKIKREAKIRKKEFLKCSGKTRKNLIEFYKKEKEIFEAESDALISFIKVVKKSEFPPENETLAKLVTQISGDIMEAKKTIDWKKLL